MKKNNNAGTKGSAVSMFFSGVVILTIANIMVKAVGAELNGVKALSGSCNSSGSPRSYRYATNKLMMADSVAEEAAGPSTPIEVGTIKIYANVDASFFVK